MEKKTIVVFGAALLLLADGVLSTSLADPPWDLGNETFFAPITETKLDISLELVAQGKEVEPGELTLTSPLKGVVAPGHPDTLFIVDQDGQIWAIDLTARRPVTCPGRDCVLFHDVGVTGLDQLVTLGCVDSFTVSFGGSFDERGLLGLAFHPGFAGNGLFYTYTSENNTVAPPTFPTTLAVAGTGDHQNVIAEWEAVNPRKPARGVIASSRRELMRVDWPQFNHDGGDLAFGADGKLYISMGDGGGADDRDGQGFVKCGPGFDIPIVGHGRDGNGQKLTNPLGKILRIDVDRDNSNPPSANGKYEIPGDNPFVGDGGGVIEEIFAFGLRNPYRFSFDKGTDDLYVGNVGQNDLEEVEFVTSGANLGWPLKEGTFCFNPNGNRTGFAFDKDRCPGTDGSEIEPIAQYDTHHEGHAVIGGFVYRGNDVEELAGRYVFGDFSILFRFPIGPQDHGRLFHLKPGDDDDLRKITEFQIVAGNKLSMALLGWGEDASGELYPMGNISGLPFFDEGLVLKIVPARDDDDDDD